MRSALLALTAAGFLLGCGTHPEVEAPSCSGPRRPANPHGSLLAPVEPTPAPAAPGAGRCIGVGP